MINLRIILLSILVLSCGTSEQPHGKAHDFTSTGRQLYVLPSKDKGYCVYGRYNADDTVLITERGALSAEQLGQALSYMSYWSQTASTALPTAVSAYMSVRALQETTGIFNDSMAKQGASQLGRSKLWRVIIVGGVWLIAAHAVNGLYRLIKGNYEGENAGAIAAQFFFGWMPVNFLIEDMQRRGRLETLASKYELSSISERKFNRLVKKLADKKPAFPDACPPAK